MIGIPLQAFLVFATAVVLSTVAFLPSSCSASDVQVEKSEPTLPLAKRGNDYGWWLQFCNDEKCSISYDITRPNPGCFSTGGDQVKFHPGFFSHIENDYTLLVYSGAGCNCQKSKQLFTKQQITSLKRFSLNATGGSYRIVPGNGPANNKC